MGMSKPTSLIDKNIYWTACSEAPKRHGSLTIGFDPEMNWDAKASGKRSRLRTFSGATIQKCLTMKVLFGVGVAARRVNWPPSHAATPPLKPRPAKARCAAETSQPVASLAAMLRVMLCVEIGFVSDN